MPRSSLEVGDASLTRSVVLNEVIKKFKERPLDLSKTAFVCVQHRIPQTPELLKALINGFQVDPKNIFLLGKLYSTDHETTKDFEALGVTLIETNPEDYAVGIEFTRAFMDDIEKLLQSFHNKCLRNKNPDIDRVIFQDDGGRLISSLFLPEGPGPKILKYLKDNKIAVAGNEQTSVGIDICYAALSKGGARLPFPVVMMASTEAKKILEAKFIAGQLWEKLKSVLFSGSERVAIGVLGCGKIGSSVIHEVIKGRDCQLVIYDNDKRAMEEFFSACGEFKERITSATSLEILLRKSQYVIGCTGRDTFKTSLLPGLLHGKTFISCSSENKEFLSLMLFLESTFKITSGKNPLDDIEFGNGSKLLYGGYPYNFSGDKKAVDLDNIQSTLSLLFGGLMQAAWLAKRPDSSEEYRGYKNFIVYDPDIQKFILETAFQNIKVFRDLFEEEIEAIDREKFSFLAKHIEGLLPSSEEDSFCKIWRGSLYSFSRESVWGMRAYKVPVGSPSTLNFREIFCPDDFDSFLLKKYTRIQGSSEDKRVALFGRRELANIAVVSSEDEEILSAVFLPRALDSLASKIIYLCDDDRCNPARFHFWNMHNTTLSSLRELAPLVKGLIQSYPVESSVQIEEHKILLAGVDLSLRYAAFSYRVGLIQDALDYLRLARKMLKCRQLEGEQWQFERGKREKTLSRYRFNCYLLQRDCDRFKCLPEHSGEEITAKEIDEFIQTDHANELDKAIWLWDQGEYANSIDKHLEIRKRFLSMEKGINDNEYIVALINLNLGELYLEGKKPKEAESCFELSLKYYRERTVDQTDGDSAIAFWRRGKMRAEMGFREDTGELARKFFQQARDDLLEARQIFLDLQFAEDNIFVVRLDKMLRRL